MIYGKENEQNQRVLPEEQLPDTSDWTPHPLAALIAIQGFDRVWAAATPKQREILELLLRQVGNELEVTDAKKVVADLLGVGRNRIDVAFHNLRKRMKNPL